MNLAMNDTMDATRTHQQDRTKVGLWSGNNDILDETGGSYMVDKLVGIMLGYWMVINKYKGRNNETCDRITNWFGCNDTAGQHWSYSN